MLITTLFDSNVVKILLVSLSLFIAFFVVAVRSAIHSILSLIILFVVSALIFISFFNLYFVGILFIVVYVGAVTVLFLFIIIIIPLREIDMFSSKRTVFGLLLVLGILGLLVFSRFNPEFSIFSWEVMPSDFTIETPTFLNDLQIVSHIIYYKYSFALVTAALLLFIALVIAILLCWL